MKSAAINIRIDPDVKDQAETVIGQLGLTPSTVIDMLYRQIIFRKGLPFEVRVPNQETLEALAELNAGQGQRAGDIGGMLRALKQDAGTDA